MNPDIRLTSAAERDLFELTAYISEENPAAARLFVFRVTDTFETLLDMKFMAPRYGFSGTLSEIRMFPVKEFKNFLVFYVPLEGSIQIIRVLHSARQISEHLFDTI